jgi:glutamate carboxypeptidase
MFRPLTLTLAALFLVPAPAMAKLSPAETRMIQTVDAEQERTLAMLERWVNQNSGSLNIEGVTKVGEMLRSELEPLGFKVQWIGLRQTGRAGHIVATHKGNGRGKRLLLIGHLDTVFEPDSPFQRWERKGNAGVGPGAGDDKGGMAVMIASLRAMQRAGTLRNADIEIVLTGDEEDNGNPIELARRDLVAAGKRADAALDFEGLAQDGGKDMGSIARRSSGAWTLTVTARPAHSCGIFSAAAGNGAIYELARIVDTFRRELPEDKLTFNVGLLGGGQSAKLDEGRIRLEASGKTNIIPAIAVALPALKRRVGLEHRIEVADQQQALGAATAGVPSDDVARPLGASHVDPFDGETQWFQLDAQHLADLRHALDIERTAVLVDPIFEHGERPLLLGIYSCDHRPLGAR